MGRGRGKKIDGDECVPKWEFLEVAREHKVKCPLQEEL